MENMPPHPPSTGAAPNNGAQQPHVYANGPNFTDPAHPHRGQTLQQQQQYQAAVRKVRNIRAGMFLMTFIFSAKIIKDARELYLEEHNLLQTLRLADADCAAAAARAADRAAAAAAAAQQQAQQNAKDKKQKQRFDALSDESSAAAAAALSASTNYATTYRYAASTFPIATVRTVVVHALHDFETKLAQSLEGGERTAQRNNSNDAAAAPREFPARLFGDSVIRALNRNGLTQEAQRRGIPYPTSEQAGVSSYDHAVLKSMLKIGQVFSFNGFGNIWAEPKQ